MAKNLKKKEAFQCENVDFAATKSIKQENQQQVHRPCPSHWQTLVVATESCCKKLMQKAWMKIYEVERKLQTRRQWWRQQWKCAMTNKTWRSYEKQTINKDGDKDDIENWRSELTT